MNDIAVECQFRKELAGKIELSNSAYVRLFERMLAETLLIQRSKFKSQIKKINELKALIAELTVNELNGRDSIKCAADSVQQMELEMAGFEILVLRSLELEDGNVAGHGFWHRKKSNGSCG